MILVRFILISWISIHVYIRRKWDSEGAEESRQDYWEAGYTAKREIANAHL